MAQPNQCFAMTNTNGQPMILEYPTNTECEYPTNNGFPPPYRVNGGDCTNAANESATGHYQPM